MLEKEEIVEGEYLEVNEDVVPNITPAALKKSREEYKEDAAKMISSAYKTGEINRAQADQLRMQLGIDRSSFTKKRFITEEKRRHLRKLQRQARKVNKQRGFRGQKVR